MDNIWLFGVSVYAYFGVWFLLSKSTSGWKHMQRVFLLALLCAPINIDGNVWTVFGNAASEKSVYSIFSVYQKADRNAFAVIGLMPYQKAGRKAFVSAGLVGYQEASQESILGIGLTGYQRAKNVGIAMGLAGYQKAELTATAKIAVAFYQKVGDKEKTFAVWSDTRSRNATE